MKGRESVDAGDSSCLFEQLCSPWQVATRELGSECRIIRLTIDRCVARNRLFTD